MQIQDSPERYGTVSRFLHWGMALLIFWQFATAGAHWLLEDTSIEAFLWPTHKPLGALLLALVLIRGIWSLYNAGHRPPSLNLPAKLGHLALYALIIAVPVLALMRQYGSGRAFEPFGIPLMPGFEGGKIDWMMAPGNLLHGWLGWLLLLFIIGHIVMAVFHRHRPGDEDVMARMIGNRRPRR